MSGILVGIASSGRPVNIGWSLSLINLALNAPMGTFVTWMVENGTDRAGNREKLAEAAIAGGARYLFFLDDDTICPNTTLKYLAYEIEKDPAIMICGGIYCTKELPSVPIVMKRFGDGPYFRWKKGEVFDCEGLGTGAMLIKTEVFQHLEKPWFYEPNEAPVGESIKMGDKVVPIMHRSGTEDLYFCRKVLDAGFRIVAHGGVIGLHVGQDGTPYGLDPSAFPLRKEA